MLAISPVTLDPHNLWTKKCKLCDLSIFYIQDLLLGDGECFILDMFEKAKGIKVKFWEMLRNMLSQMKRSYLSPSFQKGVNAMS